LTLSEFFDTQKVFGMNVAKRVDLITSFRFELV